MKIPQNKFKEVTEQTTYGIWNGIVDSYAGEICAGSGFDWMVIDGEHAPFDLRTILHQLQAVSKYDISVFVRPPVGDPSLIKQLLDAGVQSLIIPMVETADQAKELVAAMRYPPHGIRGIGTGLARAAQWNRVDNYYAESNEQMCLIVQVESVLGIENLDQILNVEGVDGVFIGPSDLAGSMGHNGDFTKPEVKETIKKSLDKIRKTGKTAGILALSEELVKEYENQGANMIGVGVDTLVLADTLALLAKKIRDRH